MAGNIIMKSMNDVCKDVEKRFIKAGVNTINIIAASAKNNSKREIESKFTTRNNFTVKNLHFEKCGSNVRSLNEIKSYTGILAPAGYMARQETGGAHKSKSGNNLIIPNTNARYGKKTAPVASMYRYSKIKQKLQKRRDSSKQALAEAAFKAASLGDGRDKGFIRIDNTIFQVTKFEPKKDNRMFVSKPILNLKHATTYTPKKEWLQPASEYAAQMMQSVFNSQMDKLK